MSEDKLRRIVEENFVLNSLHTREMGAKLRVHLKAVTDQMGTVTEQMSMVRDQMSDLTEMVESGFNEQADRMDRMVEALRGLGDGGVEIRRDVEDLKRRVKALEDKAS